MSILNGLADRFKTLSPQQIADSAYTPLIENPALLESYLMENLTSIPQVVTGIGDDGSGNCLVFEPNEKRVLKLFPLQVQLIRRMSRMFKIKRIRRRAR